MNFQFLKNLKSIFPWKHNIKQNKLWRVKRQSLHKCYPVCESSGFQSGCLQSVDYKFANVIVIFYTKIIYFFLLLMHYSTILMHSGNCKFYPLGNICRMVSDSLKILCNHDKIKEFSSITTITLTDQLDDLIPDLIK